MKKNISHLTINFVLLLIFFLLSGVLINAQEVTFYKVHNCFHGISYNVNNRIKTSNVIKDSLFVELLLVLNCSTDSTDQLSFSWISNDTLLIDIIPTKEKSEACCLCELQIDLTVANYKNPNMVFMCKNNDLSISPYFKKEFPVTFDIYKGDTINYVNKHGYPEGSHIEFYDCGKKETERFYSDGKIIWIKFYNKREKLEEFCLRKNAEDECYNKKEYKKLFKKKY